MGSDSITSINPATGERLGSVAVTAPEQVAGVVAQARAAQHAWDALGLQGRIRAMRRLSETLVAATDEIALLIVNEQGKGQIEAYGEVFAVLDQMQYFSRIAKRTLRTRHPLPKTGLPRVHRVVYQPYGVVGVISPWNFPFSLSMTPISAALIAGNTVVLKPSEFTPLIGALIGELVTRAGLPHGVLQVVQGDGSTGAALVSGGVQKIVFTGSAATGRKVAALAGQHLIPVTMELGGKDAAIVLEDADLDRAASGITWGANLNSGQACLAIERVYVVDAVADAFIAKVAEEFRRLRVAPGTERSAEIFAITTEQQMSVIERQVQEAQAAGAQALTGGSRRPGPGQFFAPTVLVGVEETMAVMREETFGPVIGVQRVSDADEAVRRTNDSPFGLTASIWTRNMRRARELAAQLEVGDVAVNEHGAPAGHSEVPWGGVKESGFGRTRGPEGLLEMVTTRHISWPRWQSRREAFWFPSSGATVEALRLGIPVLYGSWAQRLRALLRR